MEHNHEHDGEELLHDGHSGHGVEITFPLGLAGGIGIYDGLINTHDAFMYTLGIVEAWDELQQAGFAKRGVTLDGRETFYKVSTDLALSTAGMSAEHWENISGWHFDRVLTEGLTAAITHYITRYPGLVMQVQPLVDTGYNLQRYDKGLGYYDVHTDGGPTLGPFDRFLAAIIYLNDVDEGGATYFPLQKLRVKPVIGRIVLFPCNHLFPHAGEVPLSNDKYIISTFISNQTMMEIANNVRQ